MERKRGKTGKTRLGGLPRRARAPAGQQPATGKREKNEAVRLAAELSIYQTELEMQNEELRNSQQTIQRAREELATLYDYAPVAYFTFDPKGVIRRANQAGANLLGKTPRDLYGAPFASFTRKGFINPFLAHLTEVQENEGKRQTELLLKTARSSPVHVSVESVAIRGDGAEVQILSAMIDISERKRLEEERQALEEALRHSHEMEAVGTLAGGMAHRFNNMLAVIIGNAELVLDELQGGGEEAPHYVEQVLKESKRARDLVRQILIFSRREGWERKPVRLAGVVNDTVRLLRESLPGSMEMSVHIDRLADTVVANPSHIGQVLVNLASNAVYAMQQKGGTLTIELSDVMFTKGEAPPDVSLRPGRYARLSVRDTGVGIPEDVRNRIFEPFFTTKEPSGSTGMGLAVVYGIVRSHEGAITVESEIGKGSTFTVYLPLAVQS